jgi:hypothetical protein
MQGVLDVITFDDIYKALQEVLTSGWVVGRTVNRSCITLQNKTISEEIQRLTHTNIKVQFWSNNINNLNFEFASDKRYIEFRERLASSFAEYVFSNSPPVWLRKSKVKGCSTVAKIHLSDREDDAAKADVKAFFKFISELFDMWALQSLPALLSHEIVKENGTSPPHAQTQDNGYLPSKEDVESAYRALTHPGVDISIDTVLDQLEKNAKKMGLPLNNDWRMITEKTIEIWAKKRF